MTESEVIKYLLNNTELDTETVILVVDVLSDRGVLRLKKDYEIIKILDKLKDTYAKK